MSTIDNNSDTILRPTVTPELIELAVRRARKERSQAFWALLHTIFGRRRQPAKEAARSAAATAQPMIAAAGRC